MKGELMMSTAFDQESAQSAVTQVTADFDQSFPAGATGRLVLENPRGTIQIQAWGRPEIHVRATRRPCRSKEQYEATRVESYQQDDTLFVRTVLDPSDSVIERGALSGVAAELVRAFGELFRWTGKTAEVDYVVSAPAAYEVDVKGVSASIEAKGFRAPASLYAVSGSIAIEDQQSRVRLQTVSGSITGCKLDGPVYVESVSGVIRVDGRIAALAAKSVSGDLSAISQVSPAGPYEIRTVSGGATVGLPAPTAATISLRGVSGDVDSTLPVVAIRDRRGPGFRDWQGTLNGGGAPIQFQTVSGNLQLRETPASTNSLAVPETSPIGSEPSPADELTIPANPAETVVATAEPEPSQSEQERDGAAMKVLQALERGEVDVDEAIRRLDQLRGKS
jgi:hypothetical protein